MQKKSPRLPVVLAIGGHDPSGGAGIQADIESIGANGCHATSVLSCLTVQDSCNVSQLIPLPATGLTDQAVAILNDCQISSFKIGLLGSLSATEAVVGLLRDNPEIPVIFDPVLAAGGGSNLADEVLLNFIRQELLPLCRLITPNTLEAKRLTESEKSTTIDEDGECLLGLGPKAVLITGTHELTGSDKVTHRLYQPDTAPISSTWQRLSGEFHGSGCTLSAAIAARMAVGETLEKAVRHGLEYSWLSLQHSFKTGKCQSIPERLFRNPRQHPHDHS